jgi:hypothetical protein
MKIEHHQTKHQRFEATIKKLDDNDDYETLIEDYLLAAAHIINAAMHTLRTVPEDRDIKHNQLAGIIKRDQTLNEQSDEIAGYIQQLEQLRPSHVYGKGENGNTARKAEELFTAIKNICLPIIQK